MNHASLRFALCGFALLSCSPTPCENPTTDTLGELTAWEREYIGGPPALPPPPAFLPAEDGLALAYHEWIPETWDGTGAVVLMVPGSSAYAELYTPLGEGLAARGVFTRIIDVRGHGRSTCDANGTCGRPPTGGYTSDDDGRYWVGRPGDSRDENQIIRDLSRHVSDLHERWPDARLTLSGHSSGGGVISRYVEHGGLAGVDGVALLAPFNHFDQPQNLPPTPPLCPDTAGSAYAQVDLAALGAALRGDRHRYVLNFIKDPALTTTLDTLRYTYTTMTGMAANNPDDFLAAYSGPLLWIAASDDALLDLEQSREQFLRVPGGGAFVEVTDTSHVGLSWSDAVAELVARWSLDPTQVSSGTIDP